MSKYECLIIEVNLFKTWVRNLFTITGHINVGLSLAGRKSN